MARRLRGAKPYVVSVRLDDHMRANITKLCKVLGKSTSQILRTALEQYWYSMRDIVDDKNKRKTEAN